MITIILNPSRKSSSPTFYVVPSFLLYIVSWRPWDSTSIRQEVRSLRQPFGTNTDQSNTRWDVRRCRCGSECEDSSQAWRIPKGMGVRYYSHAMHIHMHVYYPSCCYLRWRNMMTFIVRSTHINAMLRCIAMQYNSMEYNTMQCNTMLCNATQYNTTQHSTIITISSYLTSHSQRSNLPDLWWSWQGNPYFQWEATGLCPTSGSPLRPST